MGKLQLYEKFAVKKVSSNWISSWIRHAMLLLSGSMVHVCLCTIVGVSCGCLFDPRAAFYT